MVAGYQPQDDGAATIAASVTKITAALDWIFTIAEHCGITDTALRHLRTEGT